MTTPTNEEVRRQFEAEYRNSLHLERRSDGQYMSDYTQAVFTGYQAALCSPAVAGLVGALRMAVRQNEHDMQMTGEELRTCTAALAQYATLAGESQ